MALIPILVWCALFVYANRLDARLKTLESKVGLGKKD